MMRKRYALLMALGAFAAHPASAVTFTETFEDGLNSGGWTYFSPNEQIEMSGGNPGRYLHAWMLDTFAPNPQTQGESIFTGDLRALQTTGIGVDLATFGVDFSAAERPLTLLLYSDNGTPADFDDDWAAYTMGPDIPEPGQGWIAYDFDVPAASLSLPPGWVTLALGPGSPAVMDWNALVTDVARTGFFYGDPTNFFIFQMWDVGLDNVRIGYEPAIAVERTSWGGVKRLFR